MPGFRILELRPSADWDWDWVWDRMTQASPKGHPSVTQGSRKGRIEEALLFATKLEKRPGATPATALWSVVWLDPLE
jgi:hypothetical protein